MKVIFESSSPKSICSMSLKSIWPSALASLTAIMCSHYGKVIKVKKSGFTLK